MRKIKDIFLVLLPLLLGGVVGYCCKNDFNYINTIPHNINVPSVVFIVMWSIIYLTSGLWSHFYSKRGGNLILYFFSLALNLLFTPTLFLFHKIILSLIIVIVLLGVVLFLFINDKEKTKYLLLPYVLWLIVALTLMIDLTISNF